MNSEQEVAPANRTVTVTVVVAAPANPISLTATTRCVARKVTLVTTLTNAGTVTAKADVTTPYGSKSAVSLAAGKSASQAFSTRLAQIPAGSVSATASGSQQTADFVAATCN